MDPAPKASSGGDVTWIEKIGRAPLGTASRPWILVCVCAIFFVKYCIYAWAITPLWEIPDESGHFSYIENLRHGDYPRIGETRMTDEVTQSWLGRKNNPPLNWIAQHPPLYYALAVPVASAMAVGDSNFETRVRGVRLVTAFIGALGLLGLGMFIRQTTCNGAAGLASAIFVGATPMFTHLSSGVTHDPLVLCTAAWSAYWCARWLGSDRMRDALLCALFAALCMMTKKTGIGMAAPLFTLMACRVFFLKPDFSLRKRLVVATSIWLVMFLPVCMWVLRNMIVLDAAMPDARIMRSLNPKEIGAIEFMLRYPVWQNVFLNFIALVGWAGQSHGAVSFVQASGATARYFSGAILFFSFGSLTQFVPSFRTSTTRFLVLAVAFVVALVMATHFITHDLATSCCLALLLLAIASAIRAVIPTLRGDPDAWLSFSSAAMVIAFGLAYYYTILSAYLDYGVVKALHGRYFYAVLPFGAYLLLKPISGALPSRLILLASIVALCVSDLFFLRHVFPMYGQV